MLLYLETNVYNKLADASVELRRLKSELNSGRYRLVFGATVLRELTQTFEKDPERGSKLFRTVEKLSPRLILRSVGELLREDAKKALRSNYCPEFLYGQKDIAKFEEHIALLANGNYTSEAKGFIGEKLEQRVVAFNHWKNRVCLLLKSCPVEPGESFEPYYNRCASRNRRGDLKSVCAQMKCYGKAQSCVARSAASKPTRYPHLTAFVRIPYVVAYDVLVSGTKLKENDLDDLKHALTSVSVDVFCSNDKALRRRCNLLLPNRPSVSLEVLLSSKDCSEDLKL